MSLKNKIRKLFTKNIVDVAQALVSLHIPGKVMTVAALAAGYVEVGEGNILRIETSADTFVAFDDKVGGGAVSAATNPGLKLVGAGVHYVICQEKYVRTSIAPVRAELIEL